MTISKVTRRQLLLGAGGLFTITGTGGLWLAMDKVDNMPHRKPVDRDGAFAPCAYLSIATSGEITIWVTRAEMGQGVSTALPMLLADELDANWQDVRIEQAAVGPDIEYGQHFTAASSSISGEYTMFRRAGATARAMLLSAAANRMSVSSSECVVANSIITHTPSGREVTFAEVAQSAANEWAPIRPRLKSATEFKLIGHPVRRLDTPAKVTGKATYGIDVALPHLVKAVVARPPFFGAALESFDDRETLEVPGVLSTHQIDAGVAVVAEHTYAALEGRKRLQCQWSAPPADAFSTESIYTALKEALTTPDLSEAASTPANRTSEDSASKQFAARYRLPFLAHACMEPMNCTAWVHDGRCDIWAPTQAAKQAQRVASEVTGLPLQAITVEVTQLGGGFGRRAASDYVSECVELATRLDTPVQIVWSREDDIGNAMYRPASAHDVHASLDPDSGLPYTWQHHIATAISAPHTSPDIPMTAKMGSTNLPYGFTAASLSWSGVITPLPTQIWRSVGYSYNTFVVEAFVTELAHEQNVDPLIYRQTLLKDNVRLSHCLAEVATMAEWDDQRHLGVASYFFSNTAVAMIAEVRGADLDNFRVSRVWCVIDCGTAVNPDSVVAQVEGGILDGLAAALYGKLTVHDNAIVESNFHDYPLLRMAEAPEISVQIVKSADYPSGVGEASLPGIAPAVAGALLKLTGQPVRTLPIKV